MGLVGKLEDLSLPDIIQIVSLSKRTGILTVENEGQRGVIIFKNGLVVSSISPSKNRKTLGQILLEQNLITPEDLEEALEYQKNVRYEPLGSILLKKNLISYEILQRIVKAQIYEAVSDLLNFKEGNFSFELSEIVPFDDIRCDVQNLAFLEKGLNPQQILLDALRLKDEKKRDQQDSVQEKESGAKSFTEIDTANMIEEAEPLKIKEEGKAEISLVPVILVDDDALVRKKIYAELLKKGYDVYEYSSISEGEEVAQKLRSDGKKFACIINLLLPSEGDSLLGGLEFISYLRKISSEIPIIAITNYIDNDIIQLLNKNGVNNYFLKPNIQGIKLDEYKRKIEGFAANLSKSLIEVCKKVYPEKYAEPSIPLLWKELGLDAPFTKADLEYEKEKDLQFQIAKLQKVLDELRSPNEAPEISLIILKYAAEFFDRGILFIIKDDEIVGIGGFGETGDDEPMPIKVRRIRIPVKEKTIFNRINSTMKMHKGKLPDTPWNRALIKMLGNLMPTEVAIIPLISYGKIIAYLYGDNAVNKRKLEDINALEIFMGHAGLAMENALLHKKINTLRIQ